MATYQYQARTAAGDIVAGVIQADNEQGAARALDERKLYPIRLTEQKPQRAQRGKVRLRDIGIMYGQLADLLRSGVPLVRSIDTIARASSNPRLSVVMKKVSDGVSGGKELAEAMSEQSQAFAPLHVAMVRAGEKAGFLEDVLANLSGFIERFDELQSKIRGAMIYPIILSVIALSVTVGMLVWFVPMFKTLFGQNQRLPVPTRIMFAVSDALLQGWPVILGGLAGAIIGGAMLLRSSAGRMLWERWRLRVPVIGKVIRTISVTRFCRILGTMMANGVPILQALAISKDATGSSVLAGHIDKASESVRGGQTLTGPLRACGLFPPQVLEMIAVAEESNQLDKVLVEIAETVERRTDLQVNQAVQLIEPVVLVLMAITIGTLALGLLYPILTMAQSIK
jgi:general secretion pathway protein F/type IV pilus assembly protein PilC